MCHNNYGRNHDSGHLLLLSLSRKNFVSVLERSLHGYRQWGRGELNQVFVVITVKGLVSMRKVGLFICPCMEASRMSLLFLQLHFSVTLQVSNYV